jgi:RNA polymerase sigma factor (sigma-70 family)
MARIDKIVLASDMRLRCVRWAPSIAASCYRAYRQTVARSFAASPHPFQDFLPMSVTSAADHEELDRLLLRTGQSDRKAFAELYRRTSSRLFGVCARMLSDRREAEEVLQEAYVSVWQRGASFDPTRAHAMTWLVALVRNKAIDRLRQHPGAAVDHDFEVNDVADEDPSPASRAENSEEYHRLEDCLQQLESQQRRSIREAFFSGTTYNELAERAKVPLGTMKSWIRRGLLQLRACLEA